MFGNRNIQRGNSTIKTIVNVATIVSSAMACIRFAINGIISAQTAALIMVGVVIFVAIGRSISKIGLTVIAFFLFVLYYSNGDKAMFSQLVTQLLTLFVVLIGIYIMIRGLFKR
ncbi:MAG: hypothetical protein WCL70_03325 [Paludibacter sp.]